MSDIILSINNVSKQYQLGTFGTGTLGGDVNRWWHKIRGKEDPYLMIGATNDRTSKEKTDFVWALRDINFDVKRGEVLGIIGKNGAGKSTLLKLLSRVTGPTTGTIHSAGRMASLLEVGTGFHPELTGLENIYLNGAILGMTKAEIKRKLDEIIDFSGCALYIDTPVKRYSTGMKVRLGFAVAAFLDPEILVVDEVLAVGDAEFQKKAIGKMKDVSRGDGRTVLFVSHNMASISSLCTKAMLLHNGTVNYVGETTDVISKYLEENSALTSANLKDRSDRQGNGKARIVEFKIFDASRNKQVDFIISGTLVEFELTFLNEENYPIENVEVGIAIYKNNEELLFNCSSTVYHKAYDFKPGLSRVRVRFEKWPTSCGNYYLNFFANNREGIIDWLQKGISFSVESGDFYNSGRILQLTSESALVPFKYI